MKINEVMKETGLSKRTIYYYLEEQLVKPQINEANGYNIFSRDDIDKLNIIQQLRKADFSINDIRSIIQHPNTAHFFLQKQTEYLEKEMELLQKKIDCIQRLDSQLPILISYEDLSTCIMEYSFPDKNINLKNFCKNDAKIVALYLWGSFLQELPMTEFRKYLWDKVIKEMAKTNDANILIINKYLFSLTAEKMDEEFNKRHLHLQEIISLTPMDYDFYVEKMKLKLYEILKSEKFQQQWRNCYFSNTLPITCLFDSKINELIRELSPYFTSYQDNIHACCNLLYHWLSTAEGAYVRTELLKLFQGYINIEANHHGELAALVSLPY